MLSAVWNFLKMPEAGQEYSIFSFAIFIPMFSAPFTAVILGGEFSDNTVRNKIISGRTKTEAYFSYVAVSAIAAAAMCLLSASAHFVVGLPLLGMIRISCAEFALLFAAGMLSTVTVTVLTAVITLCTHSRAAAAAVCTVAVVFMISSCADIDLKLKEKEYLNVSNLEILDIYGADPPPEDLLIPNAEYPAPEERKRLELLYDLLPGGAAVQSVWLELERPARVFGFEALWLILPTAAGWLVFKGRNIR